MNLLDKIYTVAVGTDPLLWAVNCEICNDIVSIETSDDDLIDSLEKEHIEYHSIIKPS